MKRPGRPLKERLSVGGAGEKVGWAEEVDATSGCGGWGVVVTAAEAGGGWLTLLGVRPLPRPVGCDIEVAAGSASVVCRVAAFVVDALFAAPLAFNAAKRCLISSVWTFGGIFDFGVGTGVAGSDTRAGAGGAILGRCAAVCVAFGGGTGWVDTGGLGCAGCVFAAAADWPFDVLAAASLARYSSRLAGAAGFATGGRLVTEAFRSSAEPAVAPSSPSGGR